jgi:hypothetical protein
MTLFLLNLSVADLFLSVLEPPFSVAYIISTDRLPFSHRGCKTLAALRHAVAFVVWLSLGIIALSR